MRIGRCDRVKCESSVLRRLEPRCRRERGHGHRLSGRHRRPSPRLPHLRRRQPRHPRQLRVLAPKDRKGQHSGANKIRVEGHAGVGVAAAVGAAVAGVALEDETRLLVDVPPARVDVRAVQVQLPQGKRSGLSE